MKIYFLFVILFCDLKSFVLTAFQSYSINESRDVLKNIISLNSGIKPQTKLRKKRGLSEYTDLPQFLDKSFSKEISRSNKHKESVELDSDASLPYPSSEDEYDFESSSAESSVRERHVVTKSSSESDKEDAVDLRSISNDKIQKHIRLADKHVKLAARHRQLAARLDEVKEKAKMSKQKKHVRRRVGEDELQIKRKMEIALEKLQNITHKQEKRLAMLEGTRKKRMAKFKIPAGTIGETKAELARKVLEIIQVHLGVECAVSDIQFLQRKTSKDGQRVNAMVTFTTEYKAAQIKANRDKLAKTPYKVVFPKVRKIIKIPDK